jgi:hypothetical protein
MPTLLVEQPWIIGTIGTVLSLLTLFGWLQTGNSVALKAGVGLGVATILILMFNIWTVTDAEVLQVWVSDVAAELQGNQVDKVLARIHPEASDRVAIKFTSMRVTKIHSIDVKNRGASKSAMIRMNVFAEGNIGGMEGKVPRWISLSLEKVGDKWLVADIEERDPLYEFRNNPE